MIRRLLCRYLIRRAWALAMKSADQRNIVGWRRWHYNADTLEALSLLTTVMGGHSRWMPDDVKASYERYILHCDVTGNDPLGVYLLRQFDDYSPPHWRAPHHEGIVR